MNKKAVALAVGALFLAPAYAQQNVTSTFNARLGGFVQMNVTWDSDENTGDNPSSLRKFAVLPTAIESEQSTLRWTSSRARMFLDVRGGELWGAKSRAYTEFDWDGAKIGDTGDTSATAAHTPRLRRAYMRLDGANTWALLGQHTLLFYDGVGSAASNFIEGVSSARGGMTGGSRNRAPQITAGHRIGLGGPVFELIGSAARHATDNQPAEGINDSGTRAASPAYQAMAKLTAPVFGREALIALSNYRGKEELRLGTSAATRVTQTINSTGLGLQGAMPLGPATGIGAFEVRASAFKTRNMARWNLGSNSTFGAVPNVDEVDARGGWAELNWQIARTYTLIAGAGVSKDERADVESIGGTTPRVYDNKGHWLIAAWQNGPWSSMIGYSKVNTKWLVPTTLAEISNDSKAVHWAVKYSF